MKSIASEHVFGVHVNFAFQHCLGTFLAFYALVQSQFSFDDEKQFFPSLGGNFLFVLKLL